MIIKNLCETIHIPETCRERFLAVSSPRSSILADGGVILSGVSELSERYLVQRLSPGFHLLLGTWGGRARAIDLHDGEREQEIGPGDLLVCPSGSRYRYEPLEPPWCIAWFHLRAEGSWKGLGGSPVRVVKARAGRETLQAMELYLMEQQNPEPAGVLRLGHIARLILLYLEEEAAGLSGPQENRPALSRLQEVWLAVDADLQKSWTVASLAAIVCLSPIYFIQVTKKATGLTPMHIVTRLRMQRARELLRHTEYPVKQVATLVGYQDPFAFSVAFKREEGMAPRQFRMATVNVR